MGAADTNFSTPAATSLLNNIADKTKTYPHHYKSKDPENSTELPSTDLILGKVKAGTRTAEGRSHPMELILEITPYDQRFNCNKLRLPIQPRKENAAQ